MIPNCSLRHCTTRDVVRLPIVLDYLPCLLRLLQHPDLQCLTRTKMSLLTVPRELRYEIHSINSSVPWPVKWEKLAQLKR